jgi:hypothetical protein
VRDRRRQAAIDAAMQVRGFAVVVDAERAGSA